MRMWPPAGGGHRQEFRSSDPPLLLPVGVFVCPPRRCIDDLRWKGGPPLHPPPLFTT